MPNHRKPHKNSRNKNRNKNNNNNNNHKQNKNKIEQKNNSETVASAAGIVVDEVQQTSSGLKPTSSVAVQFNDAGNSAESTSTNIHDIITPLESLSVSINKNNNAVDSPLCNEKSEIDRANKLSATTADTVTSNTATDIEHQTTSSVRLETSSPKCIFAPEEDSSSNRSPLEMGIVNTKTLKENLATDNTSIISETVSSRPEGKIVIHKIVQDAYRVESPLDSKTSEVEKKNTPKKSKSFDNENNCVVIQEMSDNSSAGDTDNPPLVSEVEFETETTIVQKVSSPQTNVRVLSIETFPIGCSDLGKVEENSDISYKARKAEKRVALETHFLPHFINPRFLDSITEENHDNSDLLQKPSDGIFDGELEDDVFIDNEAISKKANAIYPKNQKEYIKRRKYCRGKQLPAVIREETFPSVVEAKIIEQDSIEESCSTWSSSHTAESEDAEVVFINSSSSSASDLLDLDYANESFDTENNNEPTIDLDTDTLQLIGNSGAEGIILSNQKLVHDNNEAKSTILTTKDEEQQKLQKGDAKPPTTAESSEINNITEITNEPIAKEFTLDSLNNKFVHATSSHSSDSVNDREIDCNSCPTEGSESRTSCQSFENSEMSIAHGSLNSMKVANSSISSVKGDLMSSSFPFTTSNDRRVIDESVLSSSSLFSHNSPSFEIYKQKNSTINGREINNNLNTDTDTFSSDHKPSSPIDPFIHSPSFLAREQSVESHYSDVSQSTTHSQCTAIINKESLTNCDWTDFDMEIYVSGDSNKKNASFIIDPSEADSPIKKLRQICTEALASLPYGEVVLEELANVATNIGEIGAVQKLQTAATTLQLHHSEMPYPLPTLPHIDDIQVSVKGQQAHAKSVTLKHTLQDKFKSLSPPVTPKNESWLGVPTVSDPNVLVCLSPSQRSLVGGNINGTNPDTLLDAHKKFVERRGYHEFTSAQLNTMNHETNAEQEIIHTAALMRKKREGLTPPPPPLPRKTLSSDKYTVSSSEKKLVSDKNKIDHHILADTCDSDDQLQKLQSSNKTAPRSQITSKPEEQQQQKRQQKQQSESKEATATCVKISEDISAAKQTNDSDKVIREQKTIDSSSSVSSTIHIKKEESNSQFPTTKMKEKQSEKDSENVKKFFPFSNLPFSIPKRFSSFETAHLVSPAPDDVGEQRKRYSNVETSTYESKKRIENGHVVYDVTKSNREYFSDGEKPLNIVEILPLPKPVPLVKTDLKIKPDGLVADNNNTSAFQLNSESLEKKTNGLTPAFRESTTTTTTTEEKTHETFKNRNIYENSSADAGAAVATANMKTFRQNANAPAIRSDENKCSFEFDLFKDFDDLSHQLNMELESVKVGMKQGNENISSYYDLSRLSTESKEKFKELKRQRHEHMKELELEIERSRRSRQLKTPTQIQDDLVINSKLESKSHFIPISMEENHNSSTLEKSKPKLFNIPLRKGGESTQIAPASAPIISTANTHFETSQKIYLNKSAKEDNRFGRADNREKQPNSAADDWNLYANDLGSSENISRPFQREVEICYRGRRSNIRAPRLSVSTSDISDVDPDKFTHKYVSCRSIIDKGSNQTYVSTTSRRSPIAPPIPPQPTTAYNQRRRASLPRDLHEQQLKYIDCKEQQLQTEFKRLENERRRLLENMNSAPTSSSVPSKQRTPTQKLPTLSEGEVFRQQMAEEWLNRVAEREERRLQKIIKISKINEETTKSERSTTASARNRNSKTDIGDEFLERVKERRSKLAMPSDSDWESGAESQPVVIQTDGSRSEKDEPSPVKVIEGQTVADLDQLPKHLQEFAKFAKRQQNTLQPENIHKDETHKEEHCHEVTESSTRSSVKKSSFFKNIKVVRDAESTTSNAEAVSSLSKPPSRHSSSKLLPDTISHHKKTAVQVEAPGSVASSGGTRPISIVTSTSNCARVEHHHHQSNHNHHQQQQQCHDTTETTTTGAMTSAASSGGVVKRKKQTRFLPAPIRRSWSENDLLKEIDNNLILAKGFLYANEIKQSPVMFAPKFKAKAPPGTGIWTPKNQTPTSSRTNLNEIENCGNLQAATKVPPTPPPPPVVPVWTPQPSPVTERKQFRPVRFESPTLPRKYVQQDSALTDTKNAQPPWSDKNNKPKENQNHSSSAAATSISSTNNTFDFVPPTINIAEKIRNFERSASLSGIQHQSLRQVQNRGPAILRPDEVIYNVKYEYMSEPETNQDRPKKMAQLGRRQYDGIGPTTNDGMPIILRSEVKEPHQHEWYKRLYQTIHKQKHGGRYAYKSNGYVSEPEPNYDSDYSTVKYRTLDRRHLQSITDATTNVQGVKQFQDDTIYGTMPNPIKSGNSAYKNQPGRIEDYVTGHSSVSEKEKKEWWDEVMDIFNGWLKDNASTPRVFIDFAKEVGDFVQLDQAKLSPHYTEGNLSRALLKEQGYTSDSNVVFRKRELTQRNPLSPVEQKQVYRSVQAGGEPPLYGFRKPAPEKPRDFFEELKFIQITPTLTKICRSQSSKNAEGTSEQEVKELVCFPTLNKPGLSMYTPHPRKMPSFIPMDQQAPLPPNRKSSRTVSTMKRDRNDNMKRPTSTSSSRHEKCFQTGDCSIFRDRTFSMRKQMRQEHLTRSKSSGTVSTLQEFGSKELRPIALKTIHISRKPHTFHVNMSSPVGSQSRGLLLRQTNRSPVAFGRSISKERTFAEEKKRLENTLPLNRYSFTASTNILRDPNLKSPDEVKKAVRSYAACPIYARSRSLPRVFLPSKNIAVRSLSQQVSKKTPQKSFHATITEAIRKKATAKAAAARKACAAITESKEKSQTVGRTSPVKNITKANSIISLARTNSTFSVDSTGSKVAKSRKPITKNCINKLSRTDFSIISKDDSSVLKKIREASEGSTYDLISPTSLLAGHAQSPVTSVQHRASCWDALNKSSNMYPYRSKNLNGTKNCRSLSPSYQRLNAAEEFEENVTYNSGEDIDSETGVGRTEDLVWRYEQRSLSEPRSKPIFVHDIARPESPSRVFRQEFSPTREIRIPQTREVRSPSRRKIQSLRNGQKNEINKIIRASSLSTAEDRSKRGLHLCNNLAHSATSLNNLDRHSPTCRYRNNSQRFNELNRFYNTLARVNQLERAKSDCKTKPIRREGDFLDFEEWRKIRFHERAERELKYLIDKLKNDQRQKDFVFRPKDVDEIKWSEGSDYGLRSKDKSVEDLRVNFERKIRQEWLNEERRQELLANKDIYKPYWRSNTVADLASTMEVKYNSDRNVTFGIQPIVKSHMTGLSNRLVSSLTQDQVKKITQQLKEIYNGNNSKNNGKKEKKKNNTPEEYTITVDSNAPAASHKLKVRCNSSMTKEDLIEAVMRRKEATKRPLKATEADFRKPVVQKPSKDLPQETRNKLSIARSHSPSLLARETRGAIATENAKNFSSNVPIPPPLPSKTIYSAQNAETKPENGRSVNLPTKKLVSNANENPDESIKKKIQYFEERKYDEPSKVIYHAREDSSPDEEEVMQAVEENIKARVRNPYFQHQEMSSSLSDFREIFGEKDSTRVNFPLRRPPPPPDESDFVNDKKPECQEESFEPLYDDWYASNKNRYSPYLHRVQTGEVRKIKDKFESFCRSKKNKSEYFHGLNLLRKTRSVPELNTNLCSDEPLKITSPNKETSNVSWITHTFESRIRSALCNRGRSRTRKMISPPPRKNRLMPHIDIISKTAALKPQVNKKSYSPSPTRSEVERIRMKFENLSPDRNISLKRYHLSNSNPDIREVENISKHLTASWIAHKYPKPNDNSRSPSNPEKGPANINVPLRRSIRETRSSSTSPPRPPKLSHYKHRTLSSILKSGLDMFADQNFDPGAHRPKARYVPDGAQASWRKIPAVKFQESDVAPAIPPVPPVKSTSLNNYGSLGESPNRYFESDVNIHYKTPIRYEYKDPIPEEELAMRQAESMQKLYQEERRRKYLLELQDMNSRRHTDNFTPSQKSPIPLNRYDDFPIDLAPKSPNITIYPKTIARALYNFQGQTARELTFKKGDVIYIRRRIDKNWYEGEHNAMIGLLPANYVELLTKDGIRQPPRKPSEGQARAKFNFQAQSGIELSLNKGELVTLTRRVDDNWFEGKIANRKGIFPVSYVEVLTDIGAEDYGTTKSVIKPYNNNFRPSLDTLRTNINNEFNSLTQNGHHPPNGFLRDTKSLHKTDILHVDTNSEPIAYRALYKYRPQNSDELELQEGDIVLVLEKCDDGWFVGTSQRSGCFGTFPGNYVERV